MFDGPYEIDEDDEGEHIAEVAERLKAQRLELHLTIRAIQAGRRTPEQRRAIIDRSRRLIHKAELIRRRIRLRLMVH